MRGSAVALRMKKSPVRVSVVLVSAQKTSGLAEVKEGAGTASKASASSPDFPFGFSTRTVCRPGCSASSGYTWKVIELELIHLIRPLAASSGMLSEEPEPAVPSKALVWTSEIAGRFTVADWSRPSETSGENPLPEIDTSVTTCPAHTALGEIAMTTGVGPVSLRSQAANVTTAVRTKIPRVERTYIAPPTEGMRNEAVGVERGLQAQEVAHADGEGPDVHVTGDSVIDWRGHELKVEGEVARAHAVAHPEEPGEGQVGARLGVAPEVFTAGGGLDRTGDELCPYPNAGEENEPAGGQREVELRTRVHAEDALGHRIGRRAVSDARILQRPRVRGLCVGRLRAEHQPFAEEGRHVTHLERHGI